jgi:anthranilate/para-aminobenzoate synthase component I
MFTFETDFSQILFKKILFFIDCRYKNYSVLYSSLVTSYSGNRSIIGFDVIETINSEIYLQNKLLANDNPKIFGYFPYESLDAWNFHKKQNQEINFQYYRNHIYICHKTNKIKFELTDKNTYDAIKNFDFDFIAKKHVINPINSSSNMTDDQFKQYVNEIKNDILNGEYYQLNLTRKFFGSFSEDVSKINIFLKLSEEFPSPYSALLKRGTEYVISSSPERFITIDHDIIKSRPIKGTIKKDDKNENKKILANSVKDRAENLMIIDLMRNDLSLSAQKGSVKTGPLYMVDEFANLFHMSTDVNAVKDKDKTSFDVIRNAFPPASMTGAPKKAVMNKIAKIEKLPRGIYSGAIGYFDNNNSCDFNVVIRTIIFNGNNFEYQVGGGITYDSDPELELAETNIKAAKIRKVLGLI